MKHLANYFGRALALLVLFAVAAQAADKPAEPKSAKGFTEAEVNAAWERRMNEVMLDNMPLGEVVQQIRAQYPEINFHLRVRGPESVEISGVTVRITKLRAVTLAEFIQVLELSTDRPIQVTAKPGTRLVVFDIKAEAADSVPALETRIISLAEYIGNRSGTEMDERMVQFDDVLERARTTVLQANQGKRDLHPTINFHRGTKLLIVVGRPDELALVQEVVSGLQETARVNRFSGPPAPSTNQPTPGKGK